MQLIKLLASPSKRPLRAMCLTMCATPSPHHRAAYIRRRMPTRCLRMMQKRRKKVTQISATSHKGVHISFALMHNMRKHHHWAACIWRMRTRCLRMVLRRRKKMLHSRHLSYTCTLEKYSSYLAIHTRSHTNQSSKLTQ